MSLASTVAFSAEGLLLAHASVRRGASSSSRVFGAAAPWSSCPGGTHHISSAAAFTYPAADTAAAATASVSHSNRNHRVVTARPTSRTAMSTAVDAAATCSSSTLDTLPFDNRVIRELPVDPITDNYVRRVENACFSVVAPDPVVNPVMVAASNSALGLLGLAAEEGQREDAAEYFSGNKLMPGAQPHAHAYCGHQFGSFAGQLGDGAAMYLGEVEGPSGRWEIQFKGAGLTPYSRSADGRKVLRSSIREFLCSEAMHFLGIPTTRAAALVTSDTKVRRDVFYTGNVIQERASIVTRLAPTFLRFGSFEIFKPRDPRTGRDGPSAGNDALRLQMLEYAIGRFFPGAAAAGPKGSKARYLAMYEEAVRSTAELVAKWQCVGFTHGVLNTDNMSILGLTIDYGPYGFMDFFDPKFVPNGSDGGGRYSYERQPEMCKWNLHKFAEALAPALPLSDSTAALEKYDGLFKRYYEEGMRRKLGLFSVEEDDDGLFESLFATMADTSADFTGTFRELAQLAPGGDVDTVSKALAAQCAGPKIKAKALRRAVDIGRPSIPPQQLQGLWAMAQGNPEALAQRFSAPKDAVIAELREEMQKLSNYEAAQQRLKDMEALEEDGKGAQDAAAWGVWARRYSERLGREEGFDANRRREAMGAANPAFILRNWVAQEVIEDAEKGDFSGVQRVLRLLESPYDPPADDGEGSSSPDGRDYLRATPDWAADLVCTCSS
ncbi:unnamed protein product [Ectocarpus sp. CCAP 1310/34]|nr:unnamed protein product [Ectocarpus sp. CCAP 1310/34]